MSNTWFLVVGDGNDYCRLTYCTPGTAELTRKELARIAPAGSTVEQFQDAEALARSVESKAVSSPIRAGAVVEILRAMANPNELEDEVKEAMLKLAPTFVRRYARVFLVAEALSALDKLASRLKEIHLTSEDESSQSSTSRSCASVTKIDTAILDIRANLRSMAP